MSWRENRTEMKKGSRQQQVVRHIAKRHFVRHCSAPCHASVTVPACGCRKLRCVGTLISDEKHEDIRKQNSSYFDNNRRIFLLFPCFTFSKSWWGTEGLRSQVAQVGGCDWHLWRRLQSHCLSGTRNLRLERRCMLLSNRSRQLLPLAHFFQ